MYTFVKTFAAILLLFPVSTWAATVVIEVDTGVENINALEGTLVLPESLHVREIQTGNSVILIWVEKPRQTGNAITFAGITPGGFTGKYLIFTINGEFDERDLERVRFESVNALKNDGSGESVGVEMFLAPVEMKIDTEPPEDFTPVIASDPNIFEGKYFLVFATQDKGSGIDRYEVREGRWGWFREAKSPSLLKSQKLNKDIYVKAIDNRGNERIAVLATRMHKEWWEEPGLFVILIVVLALVALASKKSWRQSIK
jgi:hypothetical protein